MSFQRNEHVICWLKCINPATGILADPTVSIEIRIRKDDGTVVVDWTAMTKVSVGLYKYAYATATNAANETYRAEFRTTNTALNLITITTGTFVVEDLKAVPA